MAIAAKIGLPWVEIFLSPALFAFLFIINKW